MDAGERNLLFTVVCMLEFCESMDEVRRLKLYFNQVLDRDL